MPRKTLRPAPTFAAGSWALTLGLLVPALAPLVMGMTGRATGPHLPLEIR